MKQLFFLIIFSIAASVSFSQKNKITVALDGSGDYKTVQAALDAVPSNNQKPVIINIKKGTYKEVITVDATKSFITFKGEDTANTILTFNNHAGTKLSNGDTLNTWTCAS